MYERRHAPLLPWPRFIGRLLGHGALALVVLGVSLLLGVLGYHGFAGLGWIESLLNASMILGGMGPLDTLHTDAARIFASCYALFSGVIFIGSVGILLAPMVHRFLHRFHLQTEEEERS